MSKFTKCAAVGLALAVAASALTVAAPAEAGYYHRDRGGAAVAAGVAGLAAGALIGGALAQPRYYSPPPPPVYYQPAPPVYHQPAPVYYAPQPWTSEWYAYCASKYRTFDPGSGTYMTYSGYRTLCR